MTRRLHLAEISAKDLFERESGYSIPAYQREYAWDDSNARQLIDDIYGAMIDQHSGTSTNPYFLGTMLLCTEKLVAPPIGTVSNRIDVVDGQQRLITLTIVYACLRDKLKRADLAALLGSVTQPKVLLRPADADFFSTVVLAPGATSTNPPQPGENASASHKNILKNRNVIRQYLHKIGPADCAAVADYLQSHCRIVQVQADAVDYAYEIFLSINEKGKPLTVEDIFQAEIVGALDDSEREIYKHITAQIGRFGPENVKNVAQSKTFFAHLASAYGWPHRDIVTSIRTQIANHSGATGFKTAIFKPMADAYLGVIGVLPMKRALPDPATVALENLHLLAAHTNDDWVATAMLATLEIADDNEAERVFIALDRCAYVMAALGHGGAKRKAKYAVANERLREKKPVDEVLKALEWSPAELKTATKHISNKLYEMDDETCRLFLLRIDAELSKRPLHYYRALPGIDRNSTDPLSIEHLTPKGERLLKGTAADWQPTFGDTKHRIACAQYMGNLTLIHASVNKSVGQLGFDKKLEQILSSDPHQIHMTEKLRGSAWDFDALTARHKEIMAAAIRIWQLPTSYPSPPPPPRRRAARKAP